MTFFSRRFAFASLGLAAGLALSDTSAFAQPARRGEVFINSATATSGEEQASQNGLWVLDVYYKPMRQIQIELTDPKTGKKKQEYVWYIAYRVIHRKSTSRVDENAPDNQVDPPVSPPLFIPEFTLVVTDNDRNDVYADQVIPEAVAAINKREKATYKSSVDVVGPLPDPAEPNDVDAKSISGVAVWRGIDPEADRYTVYMTGFSNGIRKVGAEGEMPIVQTKTIMQKYWRRGDRFDQQEPEIVPDGESKWIYR